MKDFEIKIKDSFPKIITPNYLKIASNSEIRFNEYYPNTKSLDKTVEVVPPISVQVVPGVSVEAVPLYGSI
jgi:hypothetical protein